MVASSPGFRPDVATVTLNGRGATHDFALDGHGGVRGTVDDGAAPIPDAVVIVTDAQGRVVGRTRSATDGTFVLNGLPLGPATVTASMPQHQPAATAVTIGPADPGPGRAAAAAVDRRARRHGRSRPTAPSSPRRP